MRRLFCILGLAILAQGVALGGVALTSHDLSAQLTNDEICVFCHTPHGSSPNGPLWNHIDSTHSGTYGVYSDPASTLDATLGSFDDNDGSTSALCMTCHDGTVGVTTLFNDSNAGGVPTLAADLMGAYGTGSADLGTDMSNDHPVNFSYTTALSGLDGELFDPGVAGVNLPAGMDLFGPTGDEVQCATCHDPHSNTWTSFLTVDNSDSGLCTTCHDTK